MTGLAVTRALARQVDTRSDAIVTIARKHRGCTLRFVAFDDDRVTLLADEVDQARQILRKDAVATVMFRDAGRHACFLAHVTDIDEVGRVTLTRPKQILARDHRRFPRTYVSQRRLWAVLSHAGGRLRGLTCDVSRQGIGLQLEEGPEMPTPGDAIEVVLQLTSGRVTASGTIRNVHDRRCGIRIEEVYASAVERTELASLGLESWSGCTKEDCGACLEPA